MSKQVNSVNFTGLEKYVVSPTPALGAYTIIQEALDDAAAAGGGTVYLLAGTYNQTPTVPTGISISGVGAFARGEVVKINGGLVYDSSVSAKGGQLSNISVVGTGGSPCISATGANDITVVATNCAFVNTAGTVIDYQSTSALQFFNCSFNAGAGQKTFNQTNGNIGLWNCQTESTDTQSTINGANASIFCLSGIVNDSFDVVEGQVILYGSLIATVSTLPMATIRTNGAFGCPGCIVTDNNSASGFFLDGDGPGTSGTAFFFSFAQAPDVVMTLAFDPDLNVLGLNELPYGESGVTATAIRGNVAFDSTTFTVTDGFVTTTGSSAAWKDTIASQSIVNGEGYSVSANAVVLTLPTTASFGSSFKVSLQGGTSWQIAQNAGQSIRFGNASTTVGAGGSINSNAQGDTLTLVCDVADAHWFVENSIGNPTLI